MLSSPLLHSMREDYKLGHLDESHVVQCPFNLFDKWMNDEIQWKSITEPNAMTLSTATKDGKPSGRIVLLKYFDTKGFVFYTNYNGRKSKEMEENPYAALTFYWTQRQVRVEGTVEKVSREDSEAYFKSRPRGSQIGAWVSEFQSQEITKQALMDNQTKIEKQYHGTDIPTPEFWGGWRVVPYAFEFWQGKGGRIHDRFKYKLSVDQPLLDSNTNQNNNHQNDNNNHSNSTATCNTPDGVQQNWTIKRLSP